MYFVSTDTEEIQDEHMIISWCMCCGYAFASNNPNQKLCGYCPEVVGKECPHARPENGYRETIEALRERDAYRQRYSK
jgi:hypothetical protein